MWFRGIITLFFCFFVFLNANITALAQAPDMSLEGGAAGNAEDVDRSGFTEGVGDGSYAKGTFYDPTGIIIGFNIDSFCAAFERYGGDSWERICIMLYNCLRNTGECELLDCLKSFGNSDDEQNAYEACKVLCSIAPNIEINLPGMGSIKPCQAERCICESKCDIRKNPGACDENGFVPGQPCPLPPLGFNPPSPVCCEVLLSPVIITNDEGEQVDKFGPPPYEDDADAEERMTNVGTTKSKVLEVCTKGAGVLNCVLAIEDNISDFPPNGDGLIGTEVIDDCCNPATKDTIKDLLGGLGLGGDWLDTMCGWADVWNCAVEGLDMDDGNGSFFPVNVDSLTDQIQANLGNRNSGFATFCCKRINSIQQASPQIANVIDTACVLTNALQCGISILQSVEGSSSPLICECSNEMSPPEIQGTCDPANVDEDNIDPLMLPMSNDCPVTHPWCVNCPEDEAGSLWTHILNLDLGVALNQLTEGAAMQNIMNSCCSEIVQTAIASISPEAADFTKNVCAGFQMAECLNAFVIDLGMSNVGNQCTCSNSSATCDPNNNLPGGSNPDCSADGACTDCSGIPIGSFLSELLALEAEGAVQDAVTNGAASNILEDCCSSDEGIINIAYNIDPDFGDIISTTCAGFNLQACAISLVYFAKDISSLYDDTKPEIDNLLDIFTTSYDIFLDTIQDVTGDAIYPVYQYCCENPDTIAAANAINTNFGNGLQQVCTVIETATCVNAMADYALQEIPGDIQTTLNALAGQGLSNLDALPPTKGIQNACCGISVINNSLGPTTNMVQPIKDLNPTVGNVLEGLCHYAYAHRCGEAFVRSFSVGQPDPAQQFNTCTAGAQVGGGNLTTTHDGQEFNYCETDEDCPHLMLLDCSEPDDIDTYDPATACNEQLVTEGACGQNEDRTILNHIISIFKEGDPLHQAVIDHGILPEDFDQNCCWDKAYEAFDYFHDLLLPGATGNSSGYYLELACAADSLVQCAAQLASTVDGLTSDMFTEDNQGSIGSDIFDAVENTLGALTNQGDKNSIKQSCCAGSGVIQAANALFGTPNNVSKIVQLSCDVLEVLECATASLNLLPEPWENKTELEQTLNDADDEGTNSSALDFINDMTFNGMMVLSDQCCAADTRPAFQRVMGNNPALMNGYDAFCKILNWGYCIFGVADGIGYTFQSTKQVISNWSSDDSNNSEANNFLGEIMNHINNVGSLTDTIPQIVDHCCNVVPQLTDPDFFINNVVNVTCNDGQECEPDAYHPYMCAIAYMSQRSSPSAKFQVADCCQYVNWIPGVTCSEPDLDTECYELIPTTNPPSERRGVACQWGVREDKRGEFPCNAKSSIDWLSPIINNGNPLDGAAGPNDLVNRINLNYCGNCPIPEDGNPNSPQWWTDLKNLVAQGLECLGHGCGPAVDPDVQCLNCKAEDLYTLRNSSVTPPGLICDAEMELDGNPSDEQDQCKVISWDFVCEHCTWSLNKTDTQIIQGYNSGLQTHYCSFKQENCLPIADYINGNTLTMP